MAGDPNLYLCWSTQRCTTACSSGPGKAHVKQRGHRPTLNRDLTSHSRSWQVAWKLLLQGGLVLRARRPSRCFIRWKALESEYVASGGQLATSYLRPGTPVPPTDACQRAKARRFFWFGGDLRCSCRWHRLHASPCRHPSRFEANQHGSWHGVPSPSGLQ